MLKIIIFLMLIVHGSTKKDMTLSMLKLISKISYSSGAKFELTFIQAKSSNCGIYQFYLKLNFYGHISIRRSIIRSTAINWY